MGGDGNRQPEATDCLREKAGDEILRRIAGDLRHLIELSVEEPESYLDKWLEHFRRTSPINCWERKGCGKNDCPAFENPGARCWLVAGTLCGGEVKGEFAKKYDSCTRCDVYQESVFADSITEIYEHLLTLTTTLKQSMKKLRNMAIRDPLTGLYNRHYFNETITREIKAAERHGRELSVILVDVNDFKRINDTYGHLHGDGVLVECARILTAVARDSDIVCRFGGDEFLIVTPAVACTGIHPLAQRVEKALDEWNRNFGSDDYELSFSFGCANFMRGSQLREVIKEADLRMYEDKSNRARSREREAKPVDTP